MKRKITRAARVGSVEALFPDRRGRAAVDAAVDALPMTTTLADAVDAFEAAYFRVTGSSPFRAT